MAERDTAGEAIIAPGESFASMTAQISAIALESRAGPGWWLGFGVSAALLAMLIVAIAWLFYAGVGIWGVNVPVAWGLALVNYVWWIAIASGGTLITAIFFLAGAEWRTAVTRIAETMMVFAAACAGIMPILHLGRPWFFYWLFPYPATMQVWPQFRSPLLWDFVAIIVYISASILFWYVGMVPDLATLRDRATRRGQFLFYGILSLGWRGTASDWRHYQAFYLLMAALLTPLVISIHSVVGLDFAAGLTPGWHSTQFPPFFVFGAMLSGFAIVIALVIPIRRAYALENLITSRHLDTLGKLLLTSSIAIGYSYSTEVFMGFYGHDPFERATIAARLTGPYAPIFWATVACNVVVPQCLWARSLRVNTVLIFVVSCIVIIGMWLERYLLVITSLARDFIPSAFHVYYPTVWDWATTLGSVGLFLFGIFVSVRLLPLVAMAEMREFLSTRGGRS